MTMLDLSVIILTYNEELHLRRCLDNVCPLAREVFVIDCFSTDRTLEIARDYSSVQVLQHAWPAGKHAEQFNWALEHAPIQSSWVLRLDADEYLTPELVKELQEKLPRLPQSTTGLVLKRRHIFLGKWVRRGVYPVKLLRVFRYGKAVCERRLMDEHIQLLQGEAQDMESDFCDENLNNLSWFCHKHVDYAIREAIDLLDIELNLTGVALSDGEKRICEQAAAKREKKHRYVKWPLFWRAFAYFCYRYFLKLGFLDGKEGFLFAFIQGWWYRTLVDAKIYEIKKTCGCDCEKIRHHLQENYGISL